VATGQQGLSLPTETKQVAQLAYSPDGRYLAAISNYRTVRVWDAQSGAAALSFQSGDLGYDWLAFSPDGRTIATASGYQDFIQFWDVSRGLPAR
jgi:WD40 repeat protein